MTPLLPSQVPIEAFFKLPAAMNAAALREAASNATTWSLIDSHRFSNELNNLRKTDFQSLWAGHDFVRVHLNGAVWNHFVMNDHLLEIGNRYNLDKYSKRQLFQVVMKEFFSSPVPTLKSFILGNLAKLQGVFKVGVQIRFGGQWGDGKRYNGDTNTVTSCFVSETIKICQASECPRNCSVFITTDQPDAIPLFTKALEPHGIKVYSTKGTTVHSEKSDGDQMQHLKAFGDWYLLTLMSRLVNSRSGFSETASWFGNIPSRALMKSSTCLFNEEGVEVPDGAESFSQER